MAIPPQEDTKTSRKKAIRQAAGVVPAEAWQVAAAGADPQIIGGGSGKVAAPRRRGRRYMPHIHCTLREQAPRLVAVTGDGDHTEDGTGSRHPC